MRQLPKLSQTLSLPSSHRAELAVLESLINEVEVASTHRAADEAGPDEPKTCFGWIRRVEITLRDLVMTEAQARAKTNWPAEVEKLLGDAGAIARDTMHQRGVSAAEELVHFMQLRDVVDVIGANFSRYAPALGMTRKQFNVFMAPILKGRTEEAHSRPEHLWPEMEQYRVRLACHDLLQAVRTARGDDPS